MPARPVSPAHSTKVLADSPVTTNKHPRPDSPGPELQPPTTSVEIHAGTSAKPAVIWIALAVVVILGLAVLLLLPKIVTDSHEQTTGETAAPVTTVAVDPQDPQTDTPESARANAERNLQEFLLTRARLELANAAAWGDPEWSEALEGATRGNQLFSRREFTMAAELLLESLQLLQMLESQRGVRLAGALDSAWQSLADNDAGAATVFFTTALSIDSLNEEAQNGLERAAARAEVLSLMETGEQSLSESDWGGAQKAFGDAVELDGEYEPAQLALRGVIDQIKELTFMDAMSRALSALDNGQITVADAALRQAASIKPNAEVVLNTQQQLAEARQTLWLNNKRQEALASERDENWSAAAASYRQVLARVPQAAFARQGLAHAQDRERLHQQIDHYLANPSRLYAAQPQTNAKKLITSAGTPPAAEKRLAGKIQNLQTLLSEAGKTLTVTLQSDGMTSVQIYHVGKLGQFTSQQLELRPGTYTVVGSRPGYRDVRQTLTVTPGAAQATMDIRCEETV
jgi:hypothetical protein